MIFIVHRLYFRCTYKDEHGCLARRQVQRSEADPSVFLVTYFGDHTCCHGDDNDEQPAPFVINFGSSTRNGQPSRSCDDDDLVVCKTPDFCNSPEEEQRSSTDNESDGFTEQSMPDLMTTSMSSMEWDPLLDGHLDWMPCDGDSCLFGIGEFIGDDFDYFGLL